MPVSSQRRYSCGGLPSSGITHLLRYYAAIRLLMSLPPALLCYRLLGLTRFPCGTPSGLPGCRLFPLSDMPCSSTPETPGSTCQCALPGLGFHVFNRVAHLGQNFRGSITSACAYGLSARSPCAYPWGSLPPGQGSLPGGWPAFRGGCLSRWNITTLPGRTENIPRRRHWVIRTGIVRRLPTEGPRVDPLPLFEDPPCQRVRLLSGSR